MTETETTEAPKTGAEPVSEEVLARYEEMFASRYSDSDEAFQEYLAKGARVPPILDHYVVTKPRQLNRPFGRGGPNNRRGMKRPYDSRDEWYNNGRQRWQQENYSRRGGGGGGWGYNRGGYGGGYNNQGYGNYNNQGYGGGGYNQGYNQSYNQGYNQGYGNHGYGGGGYRGGHSSYRGSYQGGYQQQDRWNRRGGKFSPRGGAPQRKWEDY